MVQLPPFDAVEIFSDSREEPRMMLHLTNLKEETAESFRGDERSTFCTTRIPMKSMAPVSLMVVALCAFAFSGCGSKTTKPADSSTPTADNSQGDDSHGDDGHADDGHGDHSRGEHGHGDESGQSEMEKMKAGLAKLSPEDAASAEKQHICPVMDKMLGTMGAPKKVDVNGQQVWICCDGCKKKLLASPEKYLAKLKN
jgi:Cu(I)/Ag(I) efflux system membrane fusion protein